MTESPARARLYPHIGDAGAAALFIFGLALSWVWVTEVIESKAIGALVYGLLIGGLAQGLGSILCFIRGDTYLGTLLGTYGSWLIGFHFLVRNPQLGSTQARGWWVLMAIVPTVLLAVPAVRERAIAISLAFLFLLSVLVFLGLDFLRGYEWLGKATGWSALAAALPIYFLAFERLLKAVEPVHAPEVAEFTEVEERGHASSGRVAPVTGSGDYIKT